MAALTRVTVSALLSLGTAFLPAEDVQDFVNRPASFPVPSQAAAPEPAPAKSAVRKPAPKPASAEASPGDAPAGAKSAPEAKPAPKPAAVPAPDALDELRRRLDALEAKPAAAAAPAAWSFGGYIHLRYDHSAPGAIDTVYVRRVDLKLKATPAPWATLVIGFDPAELKLKDIGVELKAAKDLKVALGQFRGRFGLEQRLGSSSTFFAERALIHGGLHPFAGGPAALLKERETGVHADWTPGSKALRVELGASAVQNATEDQAAGANKNSTAYPASLTDHGISLLGRAGLSSAAVPGLSRLAVGASYLRDPRDSVAVDPTAAQQKLEEAVGFDAELAAGPLAFRGEWVASQSLSGNLGAYQRREGWYASAALGLLKPWLGADAPDLQLLLRQEGWLKAAGAGYNASSVGLKLDTLKGWSTAANFTAYAQDGDYGLTGNSGLFILQQQASF